MEIHELKKHCEDTLKRRVPERVKEEHELILKLIAENQQLQNTSSNSDYTKFLECAEDIVSLFDINLSPDLIANTIKRHFV